MHAVSFASLLPVRRSAAATLALGIAIIAPAAQAAPADILLLVDSSGSMRKPHGTGTRLEAAKKLATEVIEAVRGKHRVGLARFAQIDAMVTGGEGKRLAHSEDEDQCEHGSNLLAPPDARGAEEALRWLDGKEELGDPEIVALGDSPLSLAVEVAVGYLRNKRQGDPLRHCVNAYLVVITDGEDTCAGGGELRSRLAVLAEQAQREDIHALVLSYTPDAEAARAVARIGQTDQGARPFGPEDGSKLVAAVKAIQGRLAPEACLASGVKPIQIGAGPGAGTDGGVNPKCTQAAADDGCGCVVGGQPWRRNAAVLALLMLLALAGAQAGRRRALALLGALTLLVALAVAHCGDDAAPVCPPGDARTDGGGGPPPGKLVEPTTTRDGVLARLPTLLAAAEEVRTRVLAPLLDPDKAFAAVKDADGCVELARSIGLELYRGAQRGAAGCLATRRCNSLDKSLLLQACMKAKGATATITSCTPEEPLRQKLRAEAARAPTLPDLAAVTARERELVKQLFPSDAETQQSKLDALLAARDQGMSKYFAENVQKEVSTLEPLAKLDAEATAQGVDARVAKGLQEHFFVTAGGAAIDPSLKGSEAETGSCSDAPVQADEMMLKMKVQVLAFYAGPSQANWFGEETVMAERTLLFHSLFGQTLSVGVADASAPQLPAGVPPPSSAGCLRAFIEAGSDRTRGEPFAIGEADAASCTGTPASSTGAGQHLHKVVLRITTSVGQESSGFTVERTLVDRYGFALEDDDARNAGPMYSNQTARRLFPLRIDLPLVSGLLSPAALLDARLRDLPARKAEIEATIGERAGLPVTSPPPGPPRLLPLAVVGTVVRYSPPILGKDLTLLAERPWLVGHVQRRGFGVAGAALDIVEQTVLDVLDAPLLVVASGASDPAARLKAQLGIGALVTEAEAAAMAAGEKISVVNAGRMLRDPKLAGKWSPREPNGLEAESFPLSVREAAEKHLGELLIVTTAGSTEEGEPQIAWWRVEKETGRTLSELRYDGTFYGGAAGVKLIIDIDKCLFFSAAAMLGGAESCDAGPCIKKAWEDYAKNVAQDYVNGGLFALGGALGLGESALWGFAELGLEVMGNMNDLMEAAKLPECS